MVEITKKTQKMSENEIRELFGSRISKQEEIQWQGAGHYFYCCYRKSDYLMVLFVVGVFLLANLFGIGLAIYAGDSKLLLPLLVPLVVLPLIGMGIWSAMLKVVYPRYYIVTDRKVASCYRGLFGKNHYEELEYREYCQVSSREDKRGVNIIISRKGTEDRQLAISGVNPDEVTQITYQIERAAAEYKKLKGIK